MLLSRIPALYKYAAIAVTSFDEKNNRSKDLFTRACTVYDLWYHDDSF